MAINPSIKYTILRKPKKRCATLTIQPDNEVLVSVPKYFTESMIEDLLVKQADWIAKKTAAQRVLREKFPAKTYQTGDRFHYLGKEYVLEVRRGERREIKIEDSWLIVTAPEELALEGEDSVASMIQAWYESQAAEILKKRISHFENLMNLSSRSLEIKTLRSFWGSCAADGNLNFNARLLMAPLEVVDYVVVHELSHLTHRNHSYRFWNLVSAYVPDYGARRRWLAKYGNFLTF